MTPKCLVPPRRKQKEMEVEMVTTRRDGEGTSDRNTIEADNGAPIANPLPIFRRSPEKGEQRE